MANSPQLNCMTAHQLTEIIDIIKAQIKYEQDITDAFEKVFPDCYPPIMNNPIWSGVTKALDAALGLTDFFDWWIWETNLGADNAELYDTDGTVIHVRTADEIIQYAESLKKC